MGYSWRPQDAQRCTKFRCYSAAGGYAKIFKILTKNGFMLFASFDPKISLLAGKMRRGRSGGNPVAIGR
jgi:hypothetical protein